MEVPDEKIDADHGDPGKHHKTTEQGFHGFRIVPTAYQSRADLSKSPDETEVSVLRTCARDLGSPRDSPAMLFTFDRIWNEFREAMLSA